MAVGAPALDPATMTGTNGRCRTTWCGSSSGIWGTRRFTRLRQRQRPGCASEGSLTGFRAPFIRMEGSRNA